MTVSEKKIHMVPGLAGFEEISEYTLKPIPDNPFFYWMEADGGHPCFILTRPEYFFNDYSVQVNGDSLSNLELEENMPVVYLILTVPDKPVEMTANLLGPLLVNEEKGLACQIVLNGTAYTTKHYLFPPEKRLHCG